MKSLRFAVLAALCAIVSVAASAASAPKATGDAGWINPWYGVQTNLTFNAINTNSIDAKGSAIYSDEQNGTYTMDVQFLKVQENTAWFAGQITSTNMTLGCCNKVGTWVIYKVKDVAEPGIGQDAIWGEVLGSADAESVADVISKVQSGYTPNLGSADLNNTGMVINDGNIQVH